MDAILLTPSNQADVGLVITYSAADLWRFPSDVHFELIAGELRALSFPLDYVHGKRTALLTLFLLQHIVENDMGDGFATATGFLIAHNPDTVKAPDFAFVSHARLPKVRGAGYVDAVPDLVLETRSPSDRDKLAKAKIDEWLHAGVSVVLDLNPALQTLTVYQNGTPPQTLTHTDTLSGLSVLPGFSLPLVRVFG